MSLEVPHLIQQDQRREQHTNHKEVEIAKTSLEKDQRRTHIDQRRHSSEVQDS